MLSTLEELALHQLDIEKIENFDKLCRHIQILLLQNNIIEKLENLSKLKELQYLNVALNNITKLEGLKGCESLKKLDLTCNFIDLEDLEESLLHLKEVPSLREIYFTGNPCSDWKGLRELTLAMVDSIDFLDGKDVTHSERIVAKQKLNELMVDLLTQIELKKLKEAANTTPPSENAYTRENRKKMYVEAAAEKEEKERKKNPEKYVPKKESSANYPNGEPRQCNEGKFEYKLSEWDDPEYSFFEIQVPKYMDSSLIDLNLQPKVISIRIKGKLTQLKLNDEILVEKSEIQRSQLTGKLHIRMPKISVNSTVIHLKRQEEEKKSQDPGSNKTSKKSDFKSDKENTPSNDLKKDQPLEKNNKPNAGPDSKKEKKTSEIDYTLDDIPDLE